MNYFEEDNYLKDENNNRVNLVNYTRAEATYMLDTLLECQDCEDCENLYRCVSCKGCLNIEYAENEFMQGETSRERLAYGMYLDERKDIFECTPNRFNAGDVIKMKRIVQQH